MTEPTDPLFRADAYMAETGATVLEINDRRGIILDRTVFYATGGGQPGDSGNLRGSTGDVAIATTLYAADKRQIIHVPDDSGRPARARRRRHGRH